MHRRLHCAHLGYFRAAACPLHAVRAWAGRRLRQRQACGWPGRVCGVDGGACGPCVRRCLPGAAPAWSVRPTAARLRTPHQACPPGPDLQHAGNAQGGRRVAACQHEGVGERGASRQKRRRQLRVVGGGKQHACWRGGAAPPRPPACSSPPPTSHKLAPGLPGRRLQAGPGLPTGRRRPRPHPEECQRASGQTPASSKGWAQRAWRAFASTGIRLTSPRLAAPCPPLPRHLPASLPGLGVLVSTDSSPPAGTAKTSLKRRRHHLGR